MARRLGALTPEMIDKAIPFHSEMILVCWRADAFGPVVYGPRSSLEDVRHQLALRDLFAL